MSDRSAKATQDIIEFFDRSELTKIPSDSSLRVHGARWSNISIAPTGDFSMDDLSGIQEVQGLSLNKATLQARLSRPASLDGAFAYTETPSAADSVVDVCLSTAGTYITAPEHTPRPKSQMPVPFELPPTPTATQKHFDCYLDYQTETPVQNSVQLERSNTDTTTSNNHKIVAQGTSKLTIFNEGTETAQSDRFVDGVASSIQKLASFRIQDEYPKRPISPATSRFRSPPNGKTELSRSLSIPSEEPSGVVAVRPVPFAVEPLYNKLCSSNPSLADFTGSEHSDDLDSPYKVQNRTSETVEGEPGLGAASAEDNQKQRRVVDWVGTIPDSPCSNSGSINYDDLGIIHGRKAAGNETDSVYQRNSNGEDRSMLGSSARYGNTEFEEFWKKVEAKSISPGPFSPEKGHFSPPSSAEVSPRPDGTPSSQQKGKSPLLATTTLKKNSERSLTPALQRNLLRQLSASPPPTFTPPAVSGSARSRALVTERLPAHAIPHASVSGSSISTELSPSEVALGPANTLETSVSLDHLRPAPIPKSPTHENHLHPALRAYPFFNPADHLDNGIAPVPVQEPTTRKIEEPRRRERVRFAMQERPTLSRDYMESPMRGEFARIAKEKSTKTVLKKKLRGAKEGMKRLVGRGGGGKGGGERVRGGSSAAELNCFAK